jgi:hypothetical protein
VCHFGGAAAGAVVGLCLRFLHFQWSQSDAVPRGASGGDVGGGNEHTLETEACDATTALDTFTGNYSINTNTLPFSCVSFLAMRAALDR